MSNTLPYLPFPGANTSQGPAPADHGMGIPKEFNIFITAESDFLPEGKTFEDLTPEELSLLRNRYRFSPLKPGMYQALSGFGGMI